MTKPRKITVRGHRVSNMTTRRYSVVTVRPETVVITAEDTYGRRPGTYVAFAEIVKRSDSFATAKRVAQSYGSGYGSFAVVIDTETGEEV